MSTTATRLTTTTTSCASHSERLPLIVSSPRIVPSLPIDRVKKSIKPVRSSARLISQASATTASPLVTPQTTKTKRRRGKTHTQGVNPSESSVIVRNSRELNLFDIQRSHHDLPSNSSNVCSKRALVHCSRSSNLYHPSNFTNRSSTGYHSHIHRHPIFNNPIHPSPCNLLTSQPSSIEKKSFNLHFPPLNQLNHQSLCATYTFKPPNQALLATLTFPSSPILPVTKFHFPSPSPARHQPPPHPGPLSRSFSSLQIQPARFPPQSEKRVSYFKTTICPDYQYYSPPWLSSVFRSISHPAKRSSSLSFCFSRTKKLKRHHACIRSINLFYPVDHCLRNRPPSPLGAHNSTPMSADLAYSSLVPSIPKWLTTPAASEGYTSKLCPTEGEWTGTGEGWSTLLTKPKPISTNRPSIATLSTLTRPSLPSHSNRHSRFLPSPTSQAAPLKAQLLAVLRLRSNMPPGEASLRFKKWVLWNSWVRRGQPQMRPFVPTVHSTNQSTPLKPIALHSPPVTTANSISSSGRNWTGDEVFDENGDLICDNDELDNDGDDDEIENGEDAKEPQWLCQQSTDLKDTSLTDHNHLNRSKTIVRLKLSPSLATVRYPSHYTPPASPVSPNSRTASGTLENRGFDLSKREMLKITINENLSNNRVTCGSADQKPPTPPPSPPNELCH
ncbi:hypothetical protein O181_042451 [Austropuccinia psidii MF-1]|uniref:Uncharacterized protein n=1 Tax=Austropuccinia psidii MF-1 TaxID=1389203 RepID=A0A9Q3HF54_9BASI|nr:hypothetical protein [Austropuccinia psidii MF-1]